MDWNIRRAAVGKLLSSIINAPHAAPAFLIALLQFLETCVLRFIGRFIFIPVVIFYTDPDLAKNSAAEII